MSTIDYSDSCVNQSYKELHLPKKTLKNDNWPAVQATVFVIC